MLRFKYTRETFTLRPLVSQESPVLVQELNFFTRCGVDEVFYVF